MTPDPLLEQQHVGRLRAVLAARQQAAGLRPSADQVQQIVAMLLAGDSLQETATALCLPTGINAESFVLDVVARLGTWLTHSVGPAQATVVWQKEEQQLSLLPASPYRTGLRKKAGKGKVLAPAGYEPTAWHKRSVERALAAVLVNEPGVDVVARFVARTYAQRSSTLTYPVLAGTWAFAARGRLSGLHRVSEDAVFLGQVIEAYDLMDLTRKDAKAALEELARPDVDAERVIDLTRAARWAAEGEMTRLERLASLAQARPANLPMLRTQLRGLPHQVPVAESVGALSLGQVRRIATQAGLVTDPNLRLVEASIRTQLRAMGLATDSDRLVPEAVRAAERGQLEEFWEVMAARQAGDPTWGAQLAELAA